MGVCQKLGEQHGDVFNGSRTSVWEDAKVLEVEVLVVVQQYQCS
jgi:hypothetical protein